MKKYLLILALVVSPVLFLFSFPIPAEAFILVKHPPNSGDINPDPLNPNKLTAVPASGYKFLNWSWGDGFTSPENPETFTIDSNETITANFQGLIFNPPIYSPPNCSNNGFAPFDPACWLPINVSEIFQIKLGPLSVGSPNLGGLIVDAGAYIRGKLVLPLPDTLTSEQKTEKIGNVLTLMDSSGTAGWAPLSLTCTNVSTTTPDIATLWKTATTDTCSAGYKVTGGGIKSSPRAGTDENFDTVYTESYKDPSSEAWVGRVRGVGFDATVYARCCKF